MYDMDLVAFLLAGVFEIMGMRLTEHTIGDYLSRRT